MKLTQNNQGANGLGIVGIVITILLFESLGSYIVYAVQQDHIEQVFKSSCDCGVLGCSVYVAEHGINDLIDHCQSQVQFNAELKDAVTQKAFALTIVTIILIILNITLILIAILIMRGVPG